MRIARLMGDMHAMDAFSQVIDGAHKNNANSI
jgi:hypothetical protein